MTSNLEIESEYFVETFSSKNKSRIKLIQSAFPNRDLDLIKSAIKLGLTKLSYIELLDYSKRNDIISLSVGSSAVLSYKIKKESYLYANHDYESEPKKTCVEFKSNAALKKFYVKYQLHKSTMGHACQPTDCTLASSDVLPGIRLIGAVFSPLMNGINQEITVAENYYSIDRYLLEKGFTVNTIEAQIFRIKQEIEEQYHWFEKDVYLTICSQSS